jgi:hypothetical protein
MREANDMYDFPIDEVQDILFQNKRNKNKHEHTKIIVQKEILDADMDGRERVKRFNKFRKQEWFYEKIHIDIRDSSPQYFNERISIQFYRERVTHCANFYSENLFDNRISFDVNYEYDYSWLIDFLKKQIKKNKYFIYLEKLFFWILVKKDHFNKTQFWRLKSIGETLEKKLSWWEELSREGRIKIISKQEKLDIKKQEEEKRNKKTYILKDKNTGYYKIGKSINPLDREKTLQAEKPTYKLIKIFNNDIETDLHKKYKKQNVRGEWFNLNKVQLKYICTSYE